MKYFFTLFLLFVCFTATTQLTDDFSDMDFTNNPTWTGTTADFIVNVSGEVQLNASIAGTSYLATSHNLADLDNKEWRYWAKITTAASAGNFGRIYLTANNGDLSVNPDGFYIQLGEAGSTDAVRLMKQVAGVPTQICASANGSIAASFTIGIRVVRDNLGNWDLYVDFAGGTNFALVGFGVDATILLGTHTGYLCTYTAGNATKYYFDNVYVGNEIFDTAPPTVVSVTAINANLIDVLFNEAVDPITAQDISNYTLSPFLSVTSAVIDGTNPALVHIVPSASLTNGNSYTMVTENIEDMSGNASVIQQTNFNFYIAEMPAPGDIIINEFMCDPSPVVGLPEVEFVEIFNKSLKVFNLQNWKLGDNATFGTISGSSWLLPGEYAILCATSSLVYYPNGVGVTSFPSLNNTGDDIIIQDNLGNQLDKITYSLAWYKDDLKDDGGYTIERINWNAPCSGIANWKASNDPSGGTPGAINSVHDLTPDTQAPTIQEFIVVDNNTVQVIFSEEMDSTSVQDAVITTSPLLTEASRAVTGAFPISMDIDFVESFQLSQTYTITLNNVADCWLNTATLTAQFTLPDVPAPGDVIINEFLCSEAPVVGLPEAEFVEIYNRSNKVFYMQGWKIGDALSFGTISNAYLMPGEYKILCSNASVALHPTAAGVSSFPSLNNAGDKIILKSNSGLIIDQIEYTSQWYHDDSKDDGGYSIERINSNLACSGIDNWRASIDPNGGTPGAINSVDNPTPDTQAPTIIETLATSSSSIQIVFNEGMDSTSLMNAVLFTSPNLTEQIRFVANEYPTSMTINFTQTFQASKTYNYTLTQVGDCSFNMATVSGSFALPDSPAIGDVIINEIMYNPLTGGSDWIELYNNSDKLLNLKNWSFANFANDTISNIKTITKNYLLQPNDYVVVGKDSTFVIQNYPAAIPGKFLNFTLPSYNSDSSTVYLITPFPFSNQVMDKVSYTNKWHFKLLDSDKGKSLERLNPQGISQDPGNWHTAAESIGFATPGQKNSQYYPAISSGEVSFTSETFSPDNDGFEDVLQINYELDQNGLVATLTIYDDRGRKIKNLASNELLGITGTFVWDGVDENGNKASIGIYVLVFEAFKLQGGLEFISKKAFVLAGKL